MSLIYGLAFGVGLLTVAVRMALEAIKLLRGRCDCEACQFNRRAKYYRESHDWDEWVPWLQSHPGDGASLTDGYTIEKSYRED